MSASSTVVESVARSSKGWLLVALPLGFLLGVVGGFLHESRFVIGAVNVPWGSALVVATLVVAIRALSLNLATRLAGILFLAGWLIASALMALPNPSGDIVFSNDAWSWGYLLAGCVLGAAAAAWPLHLGRSEPQPPVATAVVASPVDPSAPISPVANTDGASPVGREGRA